jgi:hypothetical protein
MSVVAISKETTERLDTPTGELGTVEVLTGKEVLPLLSDVNFIKEWDNLYQRCPWGTVFQSSAFVSTWYQHYVDQHCPILVISRHEGKLTGLLPLAAGISDLGIAGAGGYDAYYHTWLTHAHHGESFITAALHVIRKHFPGQDIILKYIPLGAPVAWLEHDPIWSTRCVIRTFSRPLLDLSDPDTDKFIRKKNFREQYNRLKKLGNVYLEPVQDIDRFSSIIDQLADQYDFRKTATHNIRPFRDNPLKKRFLLDLFRKGILITSVLRVNEEIAAGLIATTGKDGWVHGAGINTHAPTYSKYSPGYLIMQLFGVQLKQDGFAVLDITPGGHAYKERHANAHDSVIELRVTNNIKAQNFRLFFKVKEVLKARLQTRGINPQQLRRALTPWLSMANDRHSVLDKLFRLSSVGSLHPKANIKVFALTLPSSSGSNAYSIRKNSLQDLLNYSPQANGLSECKFISRATELYETGHWSYSYSENGVLQCLVWHAPQIAASLELKPIPGISNTSLPSIAVLLQDVYYHPAASDKLLLFMTELATELVASSGDNTVYLIGTSVPPALQKFSKYLTPAK